VSSIPPLLGWTDLAIPGYRILRPLGEGGMASVFLAVQESLHREVALKVLAPALAANTEFTRRFLAEGRITAQLAHPNLMAVFDIGSYGPVYYLAAEYIPGGTLRDRMDAGLGVDEALDIACDIARGLDFAHGRGVVHRDVKPGNVLFRADGSAVLADFGIAKAMDATSGPTMAGASIGTPHYMSPEQARAEPLDGRSDLYSLGVMLFEMLTGAPPYQASDPFSVALMHISHPVPTLPAPLAWLQPVIGRLLAKAPADRFATGGALLAALQSAHPDGDRPPPSGRRNQPARGRGRSDAAAVRAAPAAWLRWAVPGAAVAIVLAVALLLWPGVEREPSPLPSRTAADGVDNAAAATPPVPDDFTGESDTLPPPRPDAVHGEPVAPPAATDGSAGMATAPPSSDDGAVETAALPDLDSLLRQADAHLRHGTVTEPGRRLIFPSDASAAGLYRQALAIDPGNARARAGLQAVIAYYQRGAQGMCDRELWANCRALASDGLQASPTDAVLLGLREQAERGLARD
jgi:serine/threonine-protein kinase PpkA